MSKKFKDQTCVYCGAARSSTADHVFARQFFLESQRKDLPKVPACSKCNRAKSQAEHYLTTLLPFGGRHVDAKKNLETLVPARLARNRKLHRKLNEEHCSVWAHENGVAVRTMALPFNWTILEGYIRFVVRGLSFHHWRRILPKGLDIAVLSLTKDGEECFHALFATCNPSVRVQGNYGEGTFVYDGGYDSDNPLFAVWEFVVFGGGLFVESPETSEFGPKAVGVVTRERR